MKIVNRKQFLELPSGTVYSRYPEPIIIEGLEIKRDSLDHGEGNCDWFYNSFIGEVDAQDSGEMADIILGMENEGKEADLCIVQQRDGGFNKKEKFVIYSDSDIQKIVNALK